MSPDGNGKGNGKPKGKRVTLPDRRPPEPWERQPKEPSRSFECFVAYRDLGPRRTVAKAAEAVGRPYETLKDFCANWEWVARARMWDDEVDRRFREANIQRRMEADRRHEAIGRALVGRAARRIHAPTEAEPYGIADEDIDAADAARWIDLGVKIERATLGDGLDGIGAPDVQTGRRMKDLANDIIEIALNYVPPGDRKAFYDELKAYSDKRQRVT